MNRLLTFISALALLAVTLPVAAAQPDSDKERLLKAAYIYNFAKFTRWPVSGQRESTSLALCIMGEDPLATELERLSAKRVGEKLLQIKHIQQEVAQAECQILYVAHSAQNTYRHGVMAQAAAPILTVSEISGFARAGGIIELFHEEGKVRFLINLDAAREAGLVLSSRLLSLARILGPEVQR